MGNYSSSGLRPQVMYELKKTTHFSRAEIIELFHVFNEACAKHGTEMSVGEFRVIYREVFPNGDADSFADHVFRTYDTEGRGRIDFRQFVETLDVQLRGDLQKKVDWTFNLYDLEGNGYISREEAIKMIRQLYNLEGSTIQRSKESPEELTDRMFDRADHNKDDKISKQGLAKAAVMSKTIKNLIEGSANAAVSPYLNRQHRGGSMSMSKRPQRKGAAGSPAKRLISDERRRSETI